MRNLTWIRVLTATLVTWTPTSALAGGPSRPLQKAAFSLKLEPGFQRLPFGQDLSATLRWIRSRARGSDARKRSLMKQLKRSVVRFDVGSDVAFHGRSVVGSEFQKGNNESMLRWNDGRRTHHFFFHGKRLYKYVQPVIAPPQTLDFIDRITGLTRALGAPTGTYSPRGDETVVEARWVKPVLETRLVDQRQRFGADVLIVEHSMLARRVRAARQGQSVGKRYTIDPDLQDILE